VVSDKANAFIIDPGDEGKRIKDFLSKQKLTVRFAVLTHGHIDHFKAAADLGLPVYIHAKDAPFIQDPEINEMTSFFGTFVPIVPQRILKEGDVVELDELHFRVLNTPGHTPGGICLFADGVLFSGDTLFKNGMGRTDLPHGSYVFMVASLKKLSALDKTTVVYPGHGPQTTIGEEFPNI
ncbi:MAG: MBL fold metallo-hydrolase, partial [Candidatus Omnitrophota bacterium]